MCVQGTSRYVVILMCGHVFMWTVDSWIYLLRVHKWGLGGLEGGWWLVVGNWGKIVDKRDGKTSGFILKPRFENKIAPPKELMTLTSWFINGDLSLLTLTFLPIIPEMTRTSSGDLGIDPSFVNCPIWIVASVMQMVMMVFIRFVRIECARSKNGIGCRKTMECGIISEKAGTSQRPKRFRHPLKS